MVEMDGFGIAVLPRYLVNADMAADIIAPVLPEYELRSSNFYALYTQRKKESALVNEFIDFVHKNLT